MLPRIVGQGLPEWYNVIMIVLIHVILAISSVIAATVLTFNPTRRKLVTSNTLTGMTFVSGTALVIVTHQPLLNSCLSGIAYLGFMATMSYFASKRLALAEKRIKN